MTIDLHIRFQNQIIPLTVGQEKLKKEAKKRGTPGGGLPVGSSSSRERRRNDLSKATLINLCCKTSEQSLNVGNRLACGLSIFDRKGEIVESIHNGGYPLLGPVGGY